MGTTSRRGERGAILVWATFAVVMVAMMAGLALNVGHMLAVRGELRNAADAAALAGVMELDATTDAFDDAVSVALEQAAFHRTDRVTLNLPPGSVELGRWGWNEPPATAFHPLSEIEAQFPGDPVAIAQRVTAVRVTAEREGGLPIVFARLFGRDTTAVGAHAVAAGGGPCQETRVLPLTIADCDLLSRCGTHLFLRASPAPSDLMAFTVLSSSNPTPPSVNDVIQEAIAGGGDPHSVGDMIQVQNGNFFNPVYGSLEALRTNEPPGGWTIPVTEGYSCPNPQFNQSHGISGFASIHIVSVACCGSSAYIEVQLSCDVHDPGRGGCNYYGTWARPMLVH